MGTIEKLRPALNPKSLQLIILPTEKCNFRCTYCYETFEIGKMKPQLVEGLKRLVDDRIRRQTLDGLSLSWFGGEPLLAKEIVYDISEHAKRYYDDGRLRRLSGALTTNAYLLTPETLKRLVSLRQSEFQISLDGHEAGHDATRQYASGKGTFATIWRNLLDAHETDLEFKFTLRLHQTNANDDSMRKLVDEIVRRFTGDRRFSILFKSIENMGGPNSASAAKMGSDRVGAARRVRELAAQTRAAGFAVSVVLDGPESAQGDFSDSSTGAPAAGAVPNEASPDLAGYICYASKPNSLVIRADGRIAKCTVMFGDPRNTIGQLNSDGSITIDNELLKIWTRGLSSWDPLELGCPAQHLPKVDVVEKPIKLHYLPRKTAALVA